jgi:hypothetical protein
MTDEIHFVCPVNPEVGSYIGTVPSAAVLVTWLLVGIP